MSNNTVLHRIIKQIRGWRTRPGFPETFLFGVGCSDHQTEAYAPRFPDIRDVWEERTGRTVRGRATDFWNRFPEDIQLAKSLGCKMFRFSTAWARIEPQPGRFNDEALEHYRQVVETILAADMIPMVTLHHFVWPLHVEERGGLASNEFPHLFATYAARVAGCLGEGVRYWITFNEPNVLIFGFIKPFWERDYFLPPGQPPEFSFSQQMDTVAQVMSNLFLAHTAARAEIRKLYPEARVGVNPGHMGLPPWLQQLADRNVRKKRKREDWIQQADPLMKRALLAHGQVDVLLATLTVSPQRARQVDFSEVYYVAGQTLLVRQGSPIQSPGDLAGRTVAVVRTSTAEAAIHSLLPLATARVVSDHASALQALERRQADAILADDTILSGIMKRHPGRYQMVGGRLTDEPYAAAVVKGNPEWLDVVDSAVRAFKASPAWAEAFGKYFPDTAVPAPPRQGARVTLADMRRVEASLRPDSEPARAPLAQPRTLLRRIQERGYVSVAVKSDIPGLGYRDPQTGDWSGIEVDLGRFIARMVFGDPTRVEFRPVKTKERMPLVRSFLQVLDPLLRTIAILTTGLNSNWWHLGMAGRLPEYLCPRECVAKQDFVGFDYYWGVNSLQVRRIQNLFAAMIAGRYSQAPVYPGALYNLLKSSAKMFPHQEIILVENGCVEVADDVPRARYIDLHVRQVQRALCEGVNISAYVCWSITTNREWGAEFGPDSDFGLYHIDLENSPDLTRLPTEAAETFRKIISDKNKACAAKSS